MGYFSNLERSMEHLAKGAFFTTTDGEKVNTMTITWGFAGLAFGKTYFVAMIRPSRYTFELLEKAESFTVSIPFNENMKEALRICGTKSGRDCDKVSVAEITFSDGKSVSTPVVDGCDQYYECEITHKVESDGSDFSEKINNNFYSNGNYHYFVYGEIKEVYSNNV